MKPLIRDITLSEKDIEHFHKHGFLVLRNLISQDAVRAFKETNGESQLQNSSSSSYGDFARLGYNLHSSILEEVYSSPDLANLLNQLTCRNLRFTQAMGFELKPNKTGFNWHVGVQAFHYIMPDDFACSLWIPLDRVDTKDQHGGMAYVSRSVYSASEYFRLVYQLVQQENITDLLTPQAFDDSQYASNLESVILEKNKIEDDFEPGDAFLFDKFVWHRSCALREGPMPSRMAFVLRFIDEKSRFSRKFLEGLDVSREKFGKPLQTLYGYRFSELQDGELLSNHPQFATLDSVNI
jgi:ectoine hydroxylase-related dioxygenase (phytanoyl-CoA dioxygenase family)